MIHRGAGGFASGVFLFLSASIGTVAPIATAAVAVAPTAGATAPIDERGARGRPVMPGVPTSARQDSAEPWLPVGPAPITGGQVENVRNAAGELTNQVAGAVQAVVAHPTDSNVLYVGAVNGGIWRTTNAMAAQPDWTPLTDALESLSIRTLELDPADGSHRTLVAGVGRSSSFGRIGGVRVGLLRTTDGGDTWAILDGGGTLRGSNIAAVASRGSRLVVGVNGADLAADGLEPCADLGLFRSDDTGTSFAAAGTDLPRGRVFDVAVDPIDPEVLYAAVVGAAHCDAVANGIYKSIDGGASWVHLSDAALDARLITPTSDVLGTVNVRLSVGHANNVYVGIVNQVPAEDDDRDGRLAGVFRSADGGTIWVAMDTPGTFENGIVGVHPGGQGALHFSILADPANAFLVYVGGDRQPHRLEGGDPGAPAEFPNSIGAMAYSGRLFRGDASRPTGSQWAHLTHVANGSLAGGGTANGSAPHADSRQMGFTADGDLVEVDDGGVYRRTSPHDASGDWYSLNGDLQVTEAHDVVFDGVARVIVAGTQDTGTIEQAAPGNSTWITVSGGDGGDVAVDDYSTGDTSIRYSSAQFLLGFARRTYTRETGVQAATFPALVVPSGADALVGLFRTPIALDAVAEFRLVILAKNGVYESADKGEHIRKVGDGPGSETLNAALAYGGRDACLDNPDVLYAGMLATVFARTDPAQMLVSTAYPGGSVRDLVIDPDDWRSLFVIDATDVVHWSRDAGVNWVEITGDLPGRALRTLVFIPTVDGGKLVVGTGRGIWSSTGPNFASWQVLGTGLPAAPVFDLDYDPERDLLLAATLGRGVWSLAGAGGRCIATATCESVLCRVIELRAAVQRCGGLPRVLDRAAKAAERAQNASRRGKSKAALAKAANKVRLFDRRLLRLGKKGRVGTSLIRPLRAAARDVIDDLRSLRASGCP